MIKHKIKLYIIIYNNYFEENIKNFYYSRKDGKVRL